eukprot:765218-Hanusia_phi.AAC.3
MCYEEEAETLLSAVLRKISIYDQEVMIGLLSVPGVSMALIVRSPVKMEKYPVLRAMSLVVKIHLHVQRPGHSISDHRAGAFKSPHWHGGST